ncbi:MAG: endolytic transglycosylase MltG [Flavobacteriaceae bacterium]|nr:endolytic transglycosylase MltG [Flavobacteriaceae bacterium]
MNLKKIIWSVLLLGLIGMGFFAYKVYQIVVVPNTAFENAEAVVLIPSDATFETVKKEMDFLLKKSETFETLAKQKSYTSNVKPGRYVIKKGMNNNDIINVLRTGNTPIKVSFNNQQTLYDLAGRVGSQIEADSLEIVQYLSSSEFLETHQLSLEDVLIYFIPNTYEFYWNTSANAFAERMMKEYRRFWNEDRLVLAKKINLSPKEVSILASIVQKETVKTDEMPRVAGVYLNRLRDGWKLQADPTVIYALKKDQDDFSLEIKRVLYKDLEINSPYNTYLNTGLPPGPITMPDITAIEAVLHAEEHNFYYFVADTQRLGYHKFARTLSQHNKNRIEYQRWIDKQGIKR